MASWALVQREAALIYWILVKAVQGGVVVIPSLKRAFERALGRKIALSTLYRMLARHGWRELAGTPHPQGDPEARGRFKKTR